MAINEIPVGYKTYYKLFIENNKQKLKDELEQKKELEEEIYNKHSIINSWKDVYKKEFNVDIEKYDEFKENKYITGRFLKLTKGLLINKQNEYELVSDLFNLYDLADTQKKVYDCETNIKFYTKCINVKLKEYLEILRTYYTEVHKQMIIEGKGYSISNGIGWICINRCIFDRKKKILDYAATKKRTKELIEQGKKIYDKEEAEWCAKNGLDYKAEDKRVFICNEYCYQIPLIDCKISGGSHVKLDIADYRHNKLRGKTNEDLIKECKNDINKICELPIDLKTKVTLCDKADKILYTKFIRNENQKPIAYSASNRKDRQ